VCVDDEGRRLPFSPVVIEGSVEMGDELALCDIWCRIGSQHLRLTTPTIAPLATVSRASWQSDFTLARSCLPADLFT
jgi:hypothetical protein